MDYKLLSEKEGEVKKFTEFYEKKKQQCNKYTAPEKERHFIHRNVKEVTC
jgi:hypothetical protein